MKTIVDPDRALTEQLARIRTEFQVPTDFPPAVIAAAATATQRRLSEHVDRTSVRFVTLDPAPSVDLDQAFAIEKTGSDILLHYAIADVAWFVEDGGALDIEAWKRGETIYFPDGKASLYPPILSEGAASLLPNVDRPAIIFSVRAAADGVAHLDGVERAVIRSAAKLAYETVQPEDLPADFAELARRIQSAELERGAARVDPPEQEVTESEDGGLRLAFRPRLVSEAQNSALSLATNLAVAAVLHEHHTGLFRVMAGPKPAAIDQLRCTAGAFGLNWPRDMPLETFSRTLRPNDPKDAAFMLAIRRAGTGATYAPYRDGETPWHAAVAATYAHATAPLRRLADRYVIRAALSVMLGQPVEERVSAAFEKLPAVMARADARAGQIERAVVDLAETILLSHREGELFSAVVIDTDERGSRIQLRDVPVVARIIAKGLVPGSALDVRLAGIDTAHRLLRFAPI